MAVAVQYEVQQETGVPIPQVIVCEKTSAWAAALRRELPQRLSSRVYETRLLEHCELQLEARPGSVATIEQTWNNFEAVLELVDRVRRRMPIARVIILDETADARLVRLGRLAGAIHVTQSRLRLRFAARLATRHLSKFPDSSTQRDQLISRLPWGERQ